MFLKRLTVLIYVTLGFFIAGAILLFGLNVLVFDKIYLYSYALYHDPNLRLMITILGGVMLLCNFLFYRYFSVNVHRDKIIAFDNPSGRVSVSLMAMEDLVKRLVLRIPEIKDARVKITAKKKSLDVKTRLVLKSESSIPDMTARVQDKIRRKIQDTIGLEEPVDVSIYVGKILSEKVKKRVVVEEEESEEPVAPRVPFHGNRS